MKRVENTGLIARFLSGNRGNISMVAAILLPTLIGLAGISTDYVTMLNIRTAMRAAADAGALAASAALAEKGVTEAEAKKIVIRYLSGDSKADLDFASKATIGISSDSSSNVKTYKVTVDTGIDYEVSELTSLITGKLYPINVRSISVSTQERTQTKSPLSMYLVVDRSGSMAWPTNEVIGTYQARTEYPCMAYAGCVAEPGDPIYNIKINALKKAVAKLAAVLNSIDPNHRYVRVGADAFSTRASPPQPIVWGADQAVSYVNALTASGETYPTGAIVNAYLTLTHPFENRLHLAKTGGVPRKTMIYMTDGIESSFDEGENMSEICESMKRSGIEIYTIGFMVPKRAMWRLEACASDASHAIWSNDASALYKSFEQIGYEQLRRNSNLLTQ